jgi:hypothetical protein
MLMPLLSLTRKCKQIALLSTLFNTSIEGNEKMQSGNDYRVDVVTIANAGNGDLTKDKVSVFE